MYVNKAILGEWMLFFVFGMMELDSKCETDFSPNVDFRCRIGLRSVSGSVSGVSPPPPLLVFDGMNISPEKWSKFRISYRSAIFPTWLSP